MPNYVLIHGQFYELTNNVLYHHGIKGQKWGVRRYQNPDGSLTEAGKKRQARTVASNREAVIQKGTTLYRVSGSKTSDVSRDKLYVTATKESADFYVNAMTGGKVYRYGKAYAHEYISKTDLKLPDRKTMEKIELGLLNDEQARQEVIVSLMKKGSSREKAIKDAQAYSSGKAFVEKTASVGLLGLAGAATGSVGGPTGAAVGAAIGASTALALPSLERSRALNIARVSYGDKNNKTMNDALATELSKKGYNAMKDYNDRHMFGDNGKQSIIVFDSNKNLKSSKISEISMNDYGRSYARNYLKEHPNSKLSFDDLVKDGEAKYKERYESGVKNRNH
jgi:hypothetical protein